MISVNADFILHRPTRIAGCLVDNDSGDLISDSVMKILDFNNESRVLAGTKKRCEGNFSFELKRQKYFVIEISKPGYVKKSMCIRGDQKSVYIMIKMKSI